MFLQQECFRVEGTGMSLSKEEQYGAIPRQPKTQLVLEQTPYVREIYCVYVGKHSAVS